MTKAKARKAVLAAVGLVLMTGGALAQEQASGCGDAVTQGEINACLQGEWQQADVELNEAWMRAMDVMRDIDANLPEEERGAAAAMRDGQRAWIRFRDATCAAEGYVMHGGSAAPMLVYGCMARLTEVRRDDLNALAEMGQ